MDVAPILYNEFPLFLRRYFPYKVQKISLNAGFTCPNRDGVKGYGGCTYCNNQTFNPEYCRTEKSVTQQLEEGKVFFAHKYPEMKYLAYFQAYTNTYGELEALKRKYEEALSVSDVVGLVIGTRPDCMPDTLLHYLEAMFRQMDVSSLLDAAARVAAVLLCLTVHELCHGLAALSLGDPTAKSMDRLSLNPLRHIDWLGLLMMFTVGFGWAKPVPVDPRYFKDPKKGMALTALAGPASNFMLAFSLILISKGIYLYADYTPVWNAIYNFLHLTAILSIGLGLFNLLPIPPLDGAKVLGGLLPDRTYFALMRYERYGILVLLALSWLGLGGNFLGDAIYGVYEALFHIFFA